MLMTKSSYAETLNISKAAVSQNIGKGKIIVNAEGLIDPDDPVNSLFSKYTAGRQQSGHDKKRTGRPKGSLSRNKPDNCTVLPPIHRNDVSYPETAEDLVQQEGWQNLAQSLKVAAAFEKTRIENAKEKGKLIDREIVKKFVSKLYAIDQNEFLVSSQKIAHLVAGICGVNEDAKILELETAIQSELYKTLSHIKRLMDDFLKGLDK